MTTAEEIRNITDLYRILDEQPHWQEAIRNRVLSAELLNMPQQLAELKEIAQEHTAQLKELRLVAEEHTRQLADHTEQLRELRLVAEEHTRELRELRLVAEEHTRELRELRLVAEEHTRELRELRLVAEAHTREIAGHTEQFRELRLTAEAHTREIADLRVASETNLQELQALRLTAEEHTRHLIAQTEQISKLRSVVVEHTKLLEQNLVDHRNHATRMNRMENQAGELKGMAAQQNPQKLAVIASDFLDCVQPTIIEAGELQRIAHALGLDKSVRLSFVLADAAFRVVTPQGQEIAGAVEASWSVSQYDIDRASRNAGFLHRHLGLPAYAFVYGHNYEEGLDWKDILWMEMLR